MQRIVDGVTSSVMRLLRSRKFFYVIVGLLFVQAAWIALTARYPQAFDENYHLGLIKLHAMQLAPFFTDQPAGPAVYGALERDPSYLYHFLFSFPYRLLTSLTSSETVQIICLRFLNIGIFIAGLFVYRKLLAELNVRQTVSHVVLLFFVLLPVVPLLAGQINYDNLMFYLTGLLFLYVIRLYRALDTFDQSKQPVPMILLLQILLVGGLGSIVKFPFAPLFFAVVVLIGWLLWKRQAAIRRQLSHKLPVVVWPGRLKLIAVGGLTLIALALSIERYGINIIQYQHPVPKCDKVLSVEACMAYSPWARDHVFAATYPPPQLQGSAVYPAVWVHRMVYETMFSITSYFGDDNETVIYAPVPPLTIANYTAWTVVTIGTLAALWYWRRIWNNKPLRGLLLVTAFYGAVLFLQNFAMYLHTGEAVAIHGRYLIPMYPILLLVLVLGIADGMRQLKLERYQAALLLVTLLLFLHGGGITVWLVHSDPSWYWQQSQVAARANWLAKDILQVIVQHK